MNYLRSERAKAVKDATLEFIVPVEGEKLAAPMVGLAILVGELASIIENQEAEPSRMSADRQPQRERS